MEEEYLQKIVKKHGKYLNYKEGGERANLSEADLRGADLRWANLYGANLSGADLSGADLYGANLSWANLREANLSKANLSGADLSKADLSEADLRWADLSGTCLDPANTLPDITDKEITNDGLEIVGDKVYGYRTRHSKHVGCTEYTEGEVYTAPYFSTDTNTSCHPGIYMASKEWLKKEYPGVILVECWCLRKDLLHARDKWRCKQLNIVKE